MTSAFLLAPAAWRCGGIATHGSAGGSPEPLAEGRAAGVAAPPDRHMSKERSESACVGQAGSIGCKELAAELLLGAAPGAE